MVRSAPSCRSVAKVITCRSVEHLARTPAILAACAASLTKIAAAPASFMMYATCSGGRFGYSGTSAIDAVRQAKSAIAHSGRFSERIATRSPAWSPSSCSPSASRRTRSPTVRVEIGVYAPLIFTWSASGLSKRDSASKKSCVRVPGGVLRGPPDAIIPTSDQEDGRAGAARSGRKYRDGGGVRHRECSFRRHQKPDRAPLQRDPLQVVGRGGDLDTIEAKRDRANAA